MVLLQVCSPNYNLLLEFMCVEPDGVDLQLSVRLL